MSVQSSCVGRMSIVLFSNVGMNLNDVCLFCLLGSMMQTTRRRGGSKHVFGDVVAPSVTMLCRDAQVSLSGKNYMPEWGLCRNAFGNVVEIVFDEGKDPNAGDLPRHVIVDFPGYTGPAWQPLHPTWVPLGCLNVRCENGGCCQRTVVPLKTAYGAAIHTFQGNNVGPTKPGQPPNRFQRTVVDPDKQSFEAMCPGLSHSFATRATTLGERNDRMKSALFFMGTNMNPTRMKNLTLDRDGKTRKKVKARNQWMKRIEKNTMKTSLTKEEQNTLLKWATEHRCTTEELDESIRCCYRRNKRDDLNY